MECFKCGKTSPDFVCDYCMTTDDSGVLFAIEEAIGVQQELDSIVNDAAELDREEIKKCVEDLQKYLKIIEHYHNHVK